MSDAAQRSSENKRRSRAEAEALLISAAAELLASRDPEDITVREVSSLAKVNTRFIGEWFGGKVGLFAAAHRRIIDEQSRLASNTGTIATASPVVVQRTVRLAVWLVSKGGLGSNATDVFPTLGRLIERLMDEFNLTQRQARVAVFQLTAALNFEAMIRPHADIVVSIDEVVAQLFEATKLLGEKNLAAGRDLSAQ